MKKTILLGTALASLFILGSCKKNDDVAPVNAATELYPSPTVKIGFNLHVYASSETSARAAGLSGATVIAKQNGNTYTTTTDESGIASFAGLTEGEVQWYVKSSGFASMNGSTDLFYGGTPDVNGTNGNSTNGGSVNVNNEQTYAVIDDVTLARLGATVKFKVFGNFDFSNTANSFNDALPATAKVVLKLANGYEPNTFTVSPAADGTVTFTGLPEGVGYTVRLYHVTTNPNATPAENVSWSIGNQANGTTPAVDETLDLGNIFAN